MHDFNSPCPLIQSPVASTIGQLLQQMDEMVGVNSCSLWDRMGLWIWLKLREFKSTDFVRKVKLFYVQSRHRRKQAKRRRRESKEDYHTSIFHPFPVRRSQSFITDVTYCTHASSVKLERRIHQYHPFESYHGSAVARRCSLAPFLMYL